jgi:hypothetical protein
MHDLIGYHKVGNPSPNARASTLHIIVLLINPVRELKRMTSSGSLFLDIIVLIVRGWTFNIFYL